MVLKRKKNFFKINFSSSPTKRNKVFLNHISIKQLACQIHKEHHKDLKIFLKHTHEKIYT